jgi:transposase
MEDHSAPAPKMPETEVSTDASAPSSKRSAPAKAKRRQFTLRYKHDIVGQYDSLTSKDRGALLRREGLYYSHITKWRWQFQQTAKKAAAKTAKDRKTVSKARHDALKRQLAETTAQLEKANEIIAAQKKLSDLLFSHSHDRTDESSK